MLAQHTLFRPFLSYTPLLRPTHLNSICVSSKWLISSPHTPSLYARFSTSTHKNGKQRNYKDKDKDKDKGRDRDSGRDRGGGRDKYKHKLDSTHKTTPRNREDESGARERGEKYEAKRGNFEKSGKLSQDTKSTGTTKSKFRPKHEKDRNIPQENENNFEKSDGKSQDIKSGEKTLPKREKENRFESKKSHKSTGEKVEKRSPAAREKPPAPPQKSEKNDKNEGKLPAENGDEISPKTGEDSKIDSKKSEKSLGKIVEKLRKIREAKKDTAKKSSDNEKSAQNETSENQKSSPEVDAEKKKLAASLAKSVAASLARASGSTPPPPPPITHKEDPAPEEKAPEKSAKSSKSKKGKKAEKKSKSSKPRRVTARDQIRDIFKQPMGTFQAKPPPKITRKFTLDIVYGSIQDPFVVVNKESGMDTFHPINKEGTLEKMLIDEGAPEVHFISQVSKSFQGLMVVALSKSAAAQLNNARQEWVQRFRVLAEIKTQQIAGVPANHSGKNYTGSFFAIDGQLLPEGKIESNIARLPPLVRPKPLLLGTEDTKDRNFRKLLQLPKTFWEQRLGNPYNFKHGAIKKDWKPFLQRNPQFGSVSSKHPYGKTAVTEFKLIEQNTKKKYALYEVTLPTRAPHQIRVHFSELGLPIFGDIKYTEVENKKEVENENDDEPDSDVAVQAHFISFPDPFKNNDTVSIELPLSKQFKDIMGNKG